MTTTIPVLIIKLSTAVRSASASVVVLLNSLGHSAGNAQQGVGVALALGGHRLGHVHRCLQQQQITGSNSSEPGTHHMASLGG